MVLGKILLNIYNHFPKPFTEPVYFSVLMWNVKIISILQNHDINYVHYYKINNLEVMPNIDHNNVKMWSADLYQISNMNKKQINCCLFLISQELSSSIY